MFTYSREELQKLNVARDHTRPSRTIRRRLYWLGLSNRHSFRETQNSVSQSRRPTVPLANNGLRFGQLNSRSVTKRIAVLHDTIHDHNLDFIAITETWIKDSAPDAIKLDVAPAGFSVTHAHRGSSLVDSGVSVATNGVRRGRRKKRQETSGRGVKGLRRGTSKRGGGLALVYRDNLSVKRVSLRDPLIKDLPRTSYELLLTRLSHSCGTVFVGVIYRPPSTSLPTFIAEFTSLVDRLTGTNLVLCGDFNCKGTDGLSFDHRLDQVSSDFGLTQHVNRPTHINGNMLDLIFTNVGGIEVTDLRVVDAGVADHYLVSCLLDVPRPPKVQETIQTRRLTCLDLNDFAIKLTSKMVEFRNASTEPNADHFCTALQTSLLSTLDELAPTRLVTRTRPTPGRFVLSKEACAAKAYRRQRGRIMATTGSKSDQVQYRIACRRATRLVNTSRTAHLASLVENSENNLRQLWTTVNRLLHPPPHATEFPSDWSQTVADFFVSKVSTIKQQAAALAPQLTPDMSPPPAPVNTQLNELTLVTADEVAHILAKTADKSSALDVIPTWLLKKLSATLSPLIAELANISFKTGSFPTEFKSAQVTPILKKASLPTDDPASYRPISNLNSISKILEKLFLARISSHLCRNASNNVDSHQSAYMPRRSTETSLLRVFDDLHALNDQGSASLIISLDLSAAFDCIDHQILLHRLETDFGVAGSALSWIGSFLIGRTQRVVVKGSTSDLIPCTSGVPQGSVLGPVLFSLYTSPIERLIRRTQSLHSAYADDVNVYSSIDATNRCPAIDAAQALHDWYIRNGMLPNAAKSEAMVVGTPIQLAKLHRPLIIDIAGTRIECKESIVSLGVTIDSGLNCNRRVNDIIQACNYHLRALMHIRPVLNTKTALAIGRAIVLSRLDYCNGLLYGTSQTNIARLQCLQNRLVRAVSRLPYRSHVSEARQKMHWLPVRERIDFKLAVLTYEARKTRQPPYLAELLHEQVASRTLRSSSDTTQLVVPRTRNKRRTHSYSSAAPRVWNSLPRQIRECSTLSTFKLNLKTFLFN